MHVTWPAVEGTSPFGFVFKRSAWYILPVSFAYCSSSSFLLEQFFRRVKTIFVTTGYREFWEIPQQVDTNFKNSYNSHIVRNLHNSLQCRTLCTDECLNILDHASTTSQLKIKDAIHNQWEPLNHQLYHVNLKLCSVIIVCFVQSAFCYTL